MEWEGREKGTRGLAAKGLVGRGGAGSGPRGSRWTGFAGREEG